ncbi:hypothetical protein ACW9HQ_50890, partial [Nocardia gipuzkoensis]
MNTRSFGVGSENTTDYPGLVGNHTYSLVDVRSREDGGVELVLRNPWKDNPTVPRTIDGLTYGPDRTLTVDAAHLTKFEFLSLRGTGTRFAFGDMSAGPAAATATMPSETRTAASVFDGPEDFVLPGLFDEAREAASVFEPGEGETYFGPLAETLTAEDTNEPAHQVVSRPAL